MTKPQTLQDLIKGGHATIGDARDIATYVFDGHTTGAGPEGYIVTFPNLAELPDHIQQFIVKAFALSKVENVLDAAESDEDESLAVDDVEPSYWDETGDK